MIIGVFLGHLRPTEGGGFTFQESIMQELMLTRTDHQFVIFYSGANIFKDHQEGHFKFVCLPKHFRRSAAIFKRFFSLRNRFIIRLKKKYPKQQTLPFFDWWVRKFNIELLWLPSPYKMDTDLPYIFTVWDLQHRLQPFFPEVSANRTWSMREKFFSEATRRAAYVITGTQAGKKELQQFYGIADERIKLLPHPTPAFALKYKDEKIPVALQVPDEFVFYPAQFWAHTNHITLLKALNYCNRQFNRKINAVFVGHDYGNKSFIQKNINELGLQDQVFMFDFIGRNDMIALYQQAQVLVYISLFGPENLPPLEAMALGCPVIYSNVNGAKEQLGENVILVDPIDYKLIGNSIINLIDNGGLRNEMREKGFQCAASYTTKHYIQNMQEIFSEFQLYRNCW